MPLRCLPLATAILAFLTPTASARPPVVGKLKAPAQAAAGATIEVSARVAAGTVTVRLSGHRAALATKRRRRAGTVRLAVTVPAGARPGRHRVQVCVKVRRKRTCASRALVVVAATVPVPLPVAPPATFPAPASQPPAADPPPAEKPADPADPVPGLPAWAVPKPLTAATTADTFRSVSRTLTPDAALDVQLTDARGTALRLVVPAGAVDTQTPITITPLDSLSGTPLSGGLIGGVRLEPDGLVLLKAATLRVTPVAAPPVDRQAGFGAASGGANFHLTPLAIKPEIELTMQHFSDHGAASGTPEEQEAARQNPPPRPADQLDSALQELEAAERAAQLDGRPGDPQHAERRRQLMREAFDAVVRPALEDPTMEFEDAVTTVLRWTRQVELLFPNEFESEVADALGGLQALVQRAWDAARTQCAAGDVGASGRLLALSRSAELLSLTPFPVHEAMAACLRFDLDATIDIERDYRTGYGDGTSSSYVYVKRSVSVTDLPLRTTGLAMPTGQKVLDSGAWTVTDTDSTDEKAYSAGPAAADPAKPFEVYEFQVTIKTTDGRTAMGNLRRNYGVSGGSLRFRPGGTLDQLVVNGSQGPIPVFKECFEHVHQAYAYGPITNRIYHFGLKPTAGRFPLTTEVTSKPTASASWCGGTSKVTVRHVPS